MPHLPPTIDLDELAEIIGVPVADICRRRRAWVRHYGFPRPLVINSRVYSRVEIEAWLVRNMEATDYELRTGQPITAEHDPIHDGANVAELADYIKQRAS